VATLPNGLSRITRARGHRPRSAVDVRFDDAAEEEDRPRSHIVTDALRDYLEMDPDDE
jgi:predicted transcriptional regulator